MIARILKNSWLILSVFYSSFLSAAELPPFRFTIKGYLVDKKAVKIILDIKQRQQDPLMQYNKSSCMLYLRYKNILHENMQELPDLDIENSFFSKKIDNNQRIYAKLTSISNREKQLSKPQSSGTEHPTAIIRAGEIYDVRIRMANEVISLIADSNSPLKLLINQIVQKNGARIHHQFKRPNDPDLTGKYESSFGLALYLSNLSVPAGDLVTKKKVANNFKKSINFKESIPSSQNLFTWLNTAWLQSKFQQYVVPYKREIIAGLGFLTAGALLLLARYTESGALPIPSWTKSFFLPKSLPPGYRPGVNVKPAEARILDPDFPIRTIVDINANIERNSPSPQ
jgi:hypothetical protein